jgi:hypothetical protein
VHYQSLKEYEKHPAQERTGDAVRVRGAQRDPHIANIAVLRAEIEHHGNGAEYEQCIQKPASGFFADSFQ